MHWVWTLPGLLKIHCQWSGRRTSRQCSAFFSDLTAWLKRKYLSRPCIETFVGKNTKTIKGKEKSCADKFGEPEDIFVTFYLLSRATEDYQACLVVYGACETSHGLDAHSFFFLSCYPRCCHGNTLPTETLCAYWNVTWGSIHEIAKQKWLARRWPHVVDYEEITSCAKHSSS